MIPAGRIAIGLLVVLIALSAAAAELSPAAARLAPRKIFTTEIAAVGASEGGANGVAVQADGKAVAVGTSRCIGGRCEYASIVRYEAGGGPDPSFGEKGTVTGPASGLSEANAVALQPDGAIVVGGVVGATGVGGEARGGKFGLARYLPDGSLDGSFGTDGLVSTANFCDGPGAGTVNDLAIQPDGRIVAVGSVRCGKNRAVAIARYLSSGALDPGFRGGWVAFDEPVRAREELRGVALQPDGKIVAVGGATGKLLVIRLTKSGERDDTFGYKGFVETPMFGRAIDSDTAPQRIDIRAVATSVAILGRNRIVVAGGRDGVENTGLIVAYRSDGHFDRTFGRQGFIPMPRLFPLSIVRDSCGRFAFSGRGSPRRGVDVFAVAGLRGDGRRRHAVRLVMPFGRSGESVASSLVRGPGRVLTAVGGVPGLSGREAFGLARLSVGRAC